MKKHALISLSLNNSYFSRDRIGQILDTIMKSQYDQITWMIPDIPHQETLRMRGYADVLCIRKSRLEANRLSNHIKSAEKLFSQSLPARTLNWKSVQELPRYAVFLDTLQELFLRNILFKKEAQRMTQQLLDRHGSTLANGQALAIGAQFVLQELAGVLAIAANTPGETHYIYHRVLPILECLLSGKYGSLPFSQLKTRVVRV